MWFALKLIFVHTITKCAEWSLLSSCMMHEQWRSFAWIRRKSHCNIPTLTYDSNWDGATQIFTNCVGGEKFSPFKIFLGSPFAWKIKVPLKSGVNIWKVELLFLCKAAASEKNSVLCQRSFLKQRAEHVTTVNGSASVLQQWQCPKSNSWYSGFVTEMQFYI